MTSKEHIDSLRRHGVRLIGWDGTTKEIPEDFLETTTKFLSENGARKITYSIKVPETETYKVQELHLPVYHCLCLMVEKHFYGK